MEKIIVGADHGGFKLKEEVRAYLGRKGFSVTDAGTYSPESCDYPDSAFEVANGVSTGAYKRGILICKSGVGDSIVANKFPGVRAALCGAVVCARLSREHNDSNILVLGSAFTDTATSKRMVDIWLKTPFAGGRHKRRIDKIKKIEQYILEKAGCKR
jgi:ribose 5-phosphate isomerase B